MVGHKGKVKVNRIWGSPIELEVPKAEVPKKPNKSLFGKKE